MVHTLLGILVAVFWVVTLVVFFKGAYDIWKEYKGTKDKTMLYFLGALVVSWFFFRPDLLQAYHPFVLMAFYWNRNKLMRNIMLVLAIVPFVVGMVIQAQQNGLLW